MKYVCEFGATICNTTIVPREERSGNELNKFRLKPRCLIYLMCKGTDFDWSLIVLRSKKDPSLW